MRYTCIQKCPECDYNNESHCVTPDIGDDLPHQVSCPVGNNPMWRPYNEQLKAWVRKCPYCGSEKLKVDSKKQNHMKYDKQSGKYMEVHTGSMRCNCCHSRGPTVSVTVPVNTYNVLEQVKAAVIQKWNDRIPTIVWKED